MYAIGRGRYLRETYPQSPGAAGGSAGGPTFIDTFTNAGVAPLLIRHIALVDNAVTRITVYTIARGTAVGDGNWYKKKSSTDWTRGAGGNAILLGNDDGPPPQDNIGVGALNGMQIIQNGTGVDITWTGINFVSGTLETYIEVIPQAAATT